MPQGTFVYDIRKEPAPISDEIRGGLAGSLVCALLLALVWKRRERAPKLLAIVFLVGWAGFSAWNARLITHAHREAQALLSRGEVEWTEGVVENLVPAPPEGGFETFRVGSRAFVVSDGGSKAPGLARTSARGGPIRAGARVRIASSGKSILSVAELPAR